VPVGGGWVHRRRTKTYLAERTTSTSDAGVDRPGADSDDRSAGRRRDPATMDMSTSSSTGTAGNERAAPLTYAALAAEGEHGVDHHGPTKGAAVCTRDARHVPRNEGIIAEPCRSTVGAP